MKRKKVGSDIFENEFFFKNSQKGQKMKHYWPSKSSVDCVCLRVNFLKIIIIFGKSLIKINGICVAMVIKARASNKFKK